jgi:hypothetical protein
MTPDVQVQCPQQTSLGAIALHQRSNDPTYQLSWREPSPAGVIQQRVGGASSTIEKRDGKRAKQRVLAGESGVERSDGEPGAAGDLLHREVGDATLGDSAFHRAEQATEGGSTPGLLGGGKWVGVRHAWSNAPGRVSRYEYEFIFTLPKKNVDSNPATQPPGARLPLPRFGHVPLA